ncbi:MAG TPA: hypothetical protein VFU02_11895, partial [Polyangiaceae bacterium]|nr:hypothetical protein [Polyangiaceae bacterium]
MNACVETLKTRFLLRVLCALLFSMQQGYADTSTGPHVHVRVSLVGEAYTRELSELLSEWLSIQHLQARIQPQPRLSLDDLLDSDDSSSVRVWLMLRSSKQARLYFADERGRRFHVRDVPLDRGLDELGREKVAQVVLASVLAFVDRSLPETSLEAVKHALAEAAAEPGAATRNPAATSALAGAAPASTPSAGAAGAAPASAGAATSVPRALAMQRATTWWALALGYHVLFRGPEGWAHGPGVGLELWPVLQRFGLGFVLSGRYEWPHEESSTNLDLRLQTTALRAAVVLASVVRGRPRWTLSLGAGWDWYRFEPASTTRELSVSTGSTDSRPVACVAAGVSLP